MNIKQGYKQTEIGIIPEDWEEDTLESISAFITKGSTPTTYGFKWQQSGILFLRSECVSDNGLDLTQSMFISLAAHAVLRRSEVCEGDILVTITGNVGRVVYLSSIEVANINQHIARVRIVKPNIFYLFIYYFLSQPSIRKHFNSITTGQAYPQLSLQQVRKAKIPIPPLPEQTAIATALSDIDALIGELDKLIAKKQGIKQATMQQLLTGKKRLAGFSGEWEVKKIGELVFDFRGGAPLAPSDFVDIGHLVLPKGAVTKGGFLRVESEKIQYCSYKYADSHKNNVVDKNHTIVVLRDLVPSGPTIGLMVKFINDSTYVLAQGVYGFRVDETKATSDFLIQLSNSKEYRRVMQNTMVGSTQVHITNGAFKNVQIYLPPIEEQTAIANILSDMDAEISQLEGRRAKMGELKQGMMQELLTGRIRLNTQDSTRC